MKQLIHAIKEYCIEHYETIAVAENITSGCLQMLLGNMEDAGQYFLGGLTLGNNDQLSEQLGIAPLRPDHKNEHNLALTIDMARQVSLKFKSEIGIAINGYNTNKGDQFLPSYAAIVRFRKVIYAEKLLPQARAFNAVPIEYAQRVLRTLAEKLIPQQEEPLYTTLEILEPLS